MVTYIIRYTQCSNATEIECSQSICSECLLWQHACTVNPPSVVPRLPLSSNENISLLHRVEPGNEATIHPGLYACAAIHRFASAVSQSSGGKSIRLVFRWSHLDSNPSCFQNVDSLSLSPKFTASYSWGHSFSLLSLLSPFPSPFPLPPSISPLPQAVGPEPTLPESDEEEDLKDRLQALRS